MRSASRKTTKIAATALLALSATAVLGASPATGANGDAYQPEFAPIDPQSQILAVISDKAGFEVSSIGGWVTDPKTGHEDTYTCTNEDDPFCDISKWKVGSKYFGQTVLPNCSDTSTDFCVKSLEIATVGDQLQQAQYLRSTNQPKWNSIPEVGYPAGGSPNLYSSKNAPTAGGYDTYAVRVAIQMSWDFNTRKFVPYDLNAAIYPYRYLSDPTVKGQAGWGTHAGQVCSWVEPGGCAVPQDWAAGTRARLKIQVPSAMGGWFKGRIKNPTIETQGVKPGVNEISVSGESLNIPQFAIAISRSEKQALDATGILGGGWGGPGFEETGMSSGSSNVSRYIERYRSQLKDTATGVTSMWNFVTINAGQGSPCLNDTSKVIGMVTTNSMGYDGSSPSFEYGSLTYHVSGLHYAPDGATPNEGTYDLVMRSETARCLYGFSKAPIQATISVIDDKGEAKTAVTTVNEADGWLSMRAYGFTYSNPTLNVKLSQEQPVVSPKPSVKTTILCVKGKLTKKVSGAAPKCPAGYKKK